MVNREDPMSILYGQESNRKLGQGKLRGALDYKGNPSQPSLSLSVFSAGLYGDSKPPPPVP